MTNAYAASGVDTEAGDLAVELMKRAVGATHNDLVMGGLGGFAGMMDVSFLKSYDRPLLATSTDGVGTKVAIAQAIDKHDTIGQDLVGMVVDDIVVVGAKSLFMTDYIACGKVIPERIADIVRGIAEACSAVGVALVGGETAEHPGLLGVDDYDVAGAAVGVVDAAKLLGPQNVRVGDVVLGMASSGLHSNGYSLVRKIVRDKGFSYTDQVPEFAGISLGEKLLEPTALYTGVLNTLLESELGSAVHAMSHITGGGIAANIARVLPTHLAADIERGTWDVHPIFNLISRLGSVSQAEMEKTFNMGLGMVAVVAASRAADAVAALQSRGITAAQIGVVRNRHEGEHGDAAAKGGKGGAVSLR